MPPETTPPGPDPPPASAGSATGAPAADDPRIERLVGLCRVWGAAKFFHPFLAYRDIDWDAALVRILPKVDAAETAGDYGAAVESLLATLGDPLTRAASVGAPAPLTVPASPAPAGRGAGGAAGVRWARVLRPRLPWKTAVRPAVRWTDDGVAVVSAAEFVRFGYAANIAAALRRLLAAAAGAPALVVDLRDPRRQWPVTGPPGVVSARDFRQGLLDELPRLLERDLPLAASRHRMWSGYPPQAGPASGRLYAAFVTTGETLPARRAGRRAGRPPRARDTGQRWVFLGDGGPLAAGLRDLLAGLQAARLAVVVQEADDETGPPGRGSVAGPTDAAVALELPAGVVATVRTAEFVHPDGFADFAPDVVVSADADARAPDPALLAALRAARGERAAAPRPRRPLPAIHAAPRERAYEARAHPSRAYRLLGLFRLWNTLHYFFAYPHLLERPWEEVLRRAIPRFEAAGDAVAYALAVAAVAVETHDAHAWVDSAALRERYLGTHVPEVVVGAVEGQTVVLHVGAAARRAAPDLAVGDAVVAVDGEAVAARRERLARVLPSSTPQALRHRLHQRALLAGPAGVPARLALVDATGASGEAVVPRTARENQAAPPRLPVYTVLPEGCGYVDLTRLRPAQVDAAFEAIRDTAAVLFDLRGYPHGTFGRLAARLAARPVVAAQSCIPELHGPAPAQRRRRWAEQVFAPGGPWRYAGRVVALIDEAAISQAEHTCLVLAAATDVTFVGAPTGGANGEPTRTVLPGGIVVAFTGQEIRRADGGRLQRVGVQPHIPAAPTIAGIRAGRDEVLEAASAHLRQTRGAAVLPQPP